MPSCPGLHGLPTRGVKLDDTVEHAPSSLTSPPLTTVTGYWNFWLVTSPPARSPTTVKLVCATVLENVVLASSASATSAGISSNSTSVMPPLGDSGAVNGAMKCRAFFALRSASSAAENRLGSENE